MKFFVYGDTVVAIGNFRGKGTGDAPARGRLTGGGASTNAWVKMADGKWLCVATTIRRTRRR